MTTVSTPQNQTSTQTSTASQTVSDNTANNNALPEDGNFKLSYTPSDDKYRTYYEIFPYSFYDSDNSGIGDLKGITSKLDYLNDGDPNTTTDLGIEGIWLMPIMPSPSYHKYNISDYKNIDKDYGTMDDFKELVSEAHKRNINMIIDFVINHTSRKHEWYQKALEELKEGKTDGYAQYYHFKENNNEKGWQKTGVGDWWYECQFDSDMPDLNLTNEKVREELQDIVKFWIDAGVDGFRLDAVMWYEATGSDDSIADLKWLYDYAKSIKEDVYMVGECWTDFNVMVNYYQSGVDSFFNFDEQGPTGTVAAAALRKDAAGYVDAVVKYQNEIKQKNAEGINTPFISNHDTARSAGFLPTETAKRMAAALYITAPGNPFIYYGEEIGMTGSDNDPEKRTGMYWSADDKTGYVERIPGSKNKEVPKEAVDKQLENPDSLLNFYKKVIRLKSQNPELARGTAEAIKFDSDATAGLICEYNNSKVMIIYNTSDKATEVNIPENTFKISEIRGYLKADAGDSSNSGGSSGGGIDALFGNSSAESSTENTTGTSESNEFVVNGQKIKMPAYSVIVLK